MSTFFQQTVQAMIAKHIDRFPLLKLDQVIDWQPIKQYLNRQRTRYLRDHRGRPAYPLLSMFKAVLLGQWHSLSDPELEHSLITRIDFNLRPLQNPPKSPKFPPRHLGDFGGFCKGLPLYESSFPRRRESRSVSAETYRVKRFLEILRSRFPLSWE
ncbi:transposase [Neisseria flavescens]|nr:transposase [Neisseria flavescens]